jgi:ATP-dependent DNA helicase DinG
VLDPRLVTKKYGEVLLRSLPPFGLWHDRDVVCGALRRLAAVADQPATAGVQV